jgi:hypothetical protein
VASCFTQGWSWFCHRVCLLHDIRFTTLGPFFGNLDAILPAELSRELNLILKLKRFFLVGLQKFPLQEHPEIGFDNTDFQV